MRFSKPRVATLHRAYVGKRRARENSRVERFVSEASFFGICLFSSFCLLGMSRSGNRLRAFGTLVVIQIIPRILFIPFLTSSFFQLVGVYKSRRSRHRWRCLRSVNGLIVPDPHTNTLRVRKPHDAEKSFVGSPTCRARQVVDPAGASPTTQQNVRVTCLQSADDVHAGIVLVI